MQAAPATRHLEALCTAAERRGLRVLLSVEGVGPRTRLSRIVVDDPRRREEVVGLRITEKGLEHAARACFTYLTRATATDA